MNEKIGIRVNTEIKNVLKMSISEQNDYFRDRVIDSGVVWGLFSNGYLLSITSEDGETLIPVYATKEFAEYNAKGVLEGSIAKEFDLSFFTEQIIGDAIKEKQIVAPQLDIDTWVYLYLIGGNRSLKLVLERNMKKKAQWEKGKSDLLDNISGLFKKIDKPVLPFTKISPEKIIQKISKALSKKKQDEDFYSPPYWMDGEDPLRVFFKDAEKLRNKGRTVFGYITSYDDVIFDKYPKVDLPVKIIYSMNPSYNSSPSKLISIGEKLEALKNVDILDEEKQIIVDFLENRGCRPLNYIVPKSLSGDEKIYLTTLLIHREHLQEKMLMRRIVPILVLPDESDFSMLVPSEYWPQEYLNYYAAVREVEIEEAPPQDVIINPIKSSILANVFKYSDDEKFEYFVKEAIRNEGVWYLENDGILELEKEDESNVALFWPSEELAIIGRGDIFAHSEVKFMDIYEFIVKLLPVSKNTNVDIGILFHKWNYSVVDSKKLQNELKKELRNG